MNNALYLAAAAAGGFAIGLAYFAILWLSVRRLPTSSHPALLILASLAFRFLLALGGFYLVGAADWRRFLAALAGFTIARLFCSRRWGTQTQRLSAKATS